MDALALTQQLATQQEQLAERLHAAFSRGKGAEGVGFCTEADPTYQEVEPADYFIPGMALAWEGDTAPTLTDIKSAIDQFMPATLSEAKSLLAQASPAELEEYSQGRTSFVYWTVMLLQVPEGGYRVYFDTD